MELDKKLFEDAIIFAVEAHRGQTRKGNGAPYVIHPIEVMMTLREIKQSRNQYLLGACALLHDVVEDTDIPLSVIRDKFGMNVASIVEELTSDPELIAKMGKDIYLRDKIQKMSSYGKLLKLVDRLVNLRDCDSMPREFKIKSLLGTSLLLEGAKLTKLTKSHNKTISLINKEMNKIEKECQL